jgi:hypothetical protein
MSIYVPVWRYVLYIHTIYIYIYICICIRMYVCMYHVYTIYIYGDVCIAMSQPLTPLSIPTLSASKNGIHKLQQSSLISSCRLAFLSSPPPPQSPPYFLSLSLIRKQSLITTWSSFSFVPSFCLSSAFLLVLCNSFFFLYPFDQLVYTLTHRKMYVYSNTHMFIYLERAAREHDGNKWAFLCVAYLPSFPSKKKKKKGTGLMVWVFFVFLWSASSGVKHEPRSFPLLISDHLLSHMYVYHLSAWFFWLGCFTRCFHESSPVLFKIERGWNGWAIIHDI